MFHFHYSRSSKPFFKVLTIILIVVLPLFGFYLGTKQPKKSLPLSNDLSQIKTVTPLPTSVSVAPKKNKTLTPTNKMVKSQKRWNGLGVSFLIPNNWSPNKPINATQIPQEGGTYQQSFSSDNNNVNMTLRIEPSIKNPDGSVKSINEQYQFLPISSTKIAGQNGVTARYSPSPNLYQFLIAFPLKNNLTVTIMFYAQPSNDQSVKELENIYNTVMSSINILL